MNGNKPVFLEGADLNEEYYMAPNPYSYMPSSNVNLLELSRYARKTGKKLIELTAEEVNKFKG